jgi:hypothetical protein
VVAAAGNQGCAYQVGRCTHRPTGFSAPRAVLARQASGPALHVA